MAKKLSPADRTAKLVADIGVALFDAQHAADPKAAAKANVRDAVARWYRSDRVKSPDDLFGIIANAYMGAPFVARVLVRHHIEEAITEWLPEGSALRLALIATLPLVEAELIELLRDPGATAERIVNLMRPVFTAQLNSITNPTSPGGPMADPHPPPPAAPARPLIAYIEKLTKVATPQRRIYARIAEFSEREARPFTDVHRGIAGIAGLLRDAVVSAIDANSNTAMDELIADWGAPEFARLGGMNGTGADMRYTTAPDQFLADPKVQTLVGNLILDHFGRKGAPIPAGLTDRIDAFFDGQGVPAALRAPLRRLLQPGSIEGAVDSVENTVYPAVYGTLLGTYALPVGIAVCILATVVFAWTVWNFTANEWALAWQVFSLPGLVWRGGGLLANLAFLYGTCLAFLGSAIFVGFPYLGIRQRMVDGRQEWTWLRPARPKEPRPTEVSPGMSAEEFRTQRFREFEEDDDAWRTGYRHALILKIAAMAWSVAALSALIAVSGLIAMSWQFQWITVVVTVVVPLIAGHLLWPADDFANLLKRVQPAETEHEDKGHAHPVVEKATRAHRITGTVMIILMAGPLLHTVAVLLAPPFWALATLCVAAIMIGLGPIVVSRIVAGTSDDAPHDVREGAGKQRRWMLMRLPQLLGFGGMVGVYGCSLFFATAYSSYGWWKSCEGYEHTPECTVIDGGYADYVDSHDRWEELRDRSAKALAKRKKPVGDACVIASQQVEKMEADYRTTILSANYDVQGSQGACEDLADDARLRKQFPNWSKTCAKQRVACGTKE